MKKKKIKKNKNVNPKILPKYFKPSKELEEALKEIPEMMNNPEKYPRYNNWKDLREALLKD